MANVREATCKILELIDQGILDRDHVIQSMLIYMSEADVAHMAKLAGLFDFEDENPDEEEEGFYCDRCDTYGASPECDCPVEEEEWTPDNADYCDKASRHHY